MSFSQNIKKELMSQQIKLSQYRRATLNGIFFAKGVICEDTISISLENEEAVSYTKRLIKEFFGREVTYDTRASGRRVLFSFTSRGAAKFFEKIDSGAELFSDGELELQYFLRGVVIASARITDPEKEYLLEFFSVRPFNLMSLLSDNGIVSYMSERKRETLIYIKQNAMLEAFYAAAGMNQMLFTLINSKIKSDISNDANRITNCELNNINKAVSAAQKQLEAIKVIDDANLFSNLPEELLETARLRMAYRDLSLTQLAGVSVPKITKSGLSHRLNKIIEIAEKIKNGEKI
jgi:DNA-binding protein WhiA